jgi:hypothetical protein
VARIGERKRGPRSEERSRQQNKERKLPSTIHHLSTPRALRVSSLVMVSTVRKNEEETVMTKWMRKRKKEEKKEKNQY